MAIKLVPVKCPECGAMLNIEENRTQAFCSYCGAKVLIHNENEFTYRHVDVAELERAETDRIVKLKQIEIAEKDKVDFKKSSKERLKLSVLLFVAGALIMLVFGLLDRFFGNGEEDSIFAAMAMIGFMVIGFGSMLGLTAFLDMSKKPDNKDIHTPSDGNLKLPDNISSYEYKSYTAIAALFESAGFTNVKCVALGDLFVGFIDKPGMVDSITINGESMDTDKRYPKDAAIVISYHSKP